MLEFENFSNFDKNIIDEFTYNHPKGNIFQTHVYYSLHEKQRGCLPYGYLVLEDGQIVGLVVGVIFENYFTPISYITRRSVVIGGPLIINERTDVLDFLVKNLIEQLKKKCVYVQIRNLFETKQFRELYQDLGFVYEDHLDIIHDLSISVEDYKSGISKNKRGNINKSTNKGTVVREISNQTEFISGITLIRQTYKKVGLPLPVDNYFMNAFNTLSEKGILKTFGAFLDNKLIGVRMEFCYKGLIYDWYAGSDIDYNSYYPNDLLPYSVILWGKENGFSNFDFGGAGKPNVPYGVREHKLKFGGNLVNFGRYELVNQKVIMLFSKFAFKLFKKIKSGK